MNPYSSNEVTSSDGASDINGVTHCENTNSSPTLDSGFSSYVLSPAALVAIGSSSLNEPPSSSHTNPPSIYIKVEPADDTDASLAEPSAHLSNAGVDSKSPLPAIPTTDDNEAAQSLPLTKSFVNPLAFSIANLGKSIWPTNKVQANLFGTRDAARASSAMNSSRLSMLDFPNYNTECNIVGRTDSAQPVDLSNKRKRRLTFQDLNNNSHVNDNNNNSLCSAAFNINCAQANDGDDEADPPPRPRGCSLLKEERVMLGCRATTVLLAWYNERILKPYASTPEELSLLAKEANISASQARKWLSNKRARSGNTLAKNGQMHPKKRAKIEEIRNIVGSQQPTGAAQETLTGVNTTPEEPRVIEHVVKQEPDVGVLTDDKDINKLTFTQRNQLETWFIDHINNPKGPYPDAEEKRELSDRLGVEHSKVVNWFSNRRSRMLPRSKLQKQKPSAAITSASQIRSPTGTDALILRPGAFLGVDMDTEEEDNQTLPIDIVFPVELQDVSADAMPRQSHCSKGKRTRNLSKDEHETKKSSGKTNGPKRTGGISGHDTSAGMFFPPGNNIFSSFLGHGYGGMNTGMPFQPHLFSDGFLAPFTTVVPNRWWQPRGMHPVINPYTGQSVAWPGVGGMMPFAPPAMMPYFPYFPSSDATLPPPAHGTKNPFVSSRLPLPPAMNAADAVNNARDVTAPHISAPFVFMPPFAFPSFPDYLAQTLSTLDGSTTDPSDPKI